MPSELGRFQSTWLATRVSFSARHLNISTAARSGVTFEMSFGKSGQMILVGVSGCSP